MTINRRRFLTIAAAFAGTSAQAAGSHTWQGRALGADVTLTIKGPREIAQIALAQIPPLLAEIENLFSLYDDASDLSRLNRIGALAPLSPRFADLIRAADYGHRATGGLFDPTIQPLWQAVAQNGDIEAARATVGWNKLRWDNTQIQLAAGQALTFNGIAQGFATDLVTARLKTLGLTNALVNIGEYRAIGGPWQLALSDPEFGMLGMRTLRGNAVATSSPAATLLGDQAHIIHPANRPRWSTVSVEAVNATLADCLSTALCLAPRDFIEHIQTLDDVQRITLIDLDGNLTSI